MFSFERYLHIFLTKRAQKRYIFNKKAKRNAIIKDNKQQLRPITYNVSIGVKTRSKYFRKISLTAERKITLVCLGKKKTAIHFGRMFSVFLVNKITERIVAIFNFGLFTIAYYLGHLNWTGNKWLYFNWMKYTTCFCY